jgi:type IV pilus assembly protein PilN
MIRINLIPVKRKKKAQPLPPVIIHGIIVLTLTLLAIAGITYFMSEKISTMKENKARKEVELKGLQAQLEEVKNYERDKASYEKKIKVIKQLKQNQKAPLKLLEEVSIHIPEGVWITGLSDRGGNVSITGFAFSNTELVTYVQSLKSSEFLTDVALLESRQQKVGAASIYAFSLTLRIKV